MRVTRGQYDTRGTRYFGGIVFTLAHQRVDVIPGKCYFSETRPCLSLSSRRQRRQRWQPAPLNPRKRMFPSAPAPGAGEIKGDKQKLCGPVETVLFFSSSVA